MRFCIASSIMLVLCAVVAAGHSHGHGNDHHHQHGKAVSYAMVTKYEDHHDGQRGHHNVAQHGSHHGHVHAVKHHGYHGGHGDHSQHDHHGHAKYEFKYGVKDPKTGDIKNQWESRDGDLVKGVYSLKEADGTIRIVKYSADHKKGFQATVHKIGHPHQDLHGNNGHNQHGHHMHSHQVHHEHGHHQAHGLVYSHPDQAHGNQGHGHASSYVYFKRQDKH